MNPARLDKAAPLLAAVAALVVGPPCAHAARVDSHEAALFMDFAAAAEQAQAGLVPMEGHFTTDKLKYDKLQRYSEGKQIQDGQLVIRWLHKAAELNPDKVALRAPMMDESGGLVKQAAYKIGAHTYKYDKLTWAQYRDRVQVAAASFLSMGLKPMDAVNIRGVNSQEWLIAFLGCMAAGGLPVGLYPTDSPDTVKFKAQDSGATFIAVGKAKDLKVYSEFLDEPEFGSVKAVIYWDHNPLHPEKLDPAVLDKLRGKTRQFLMWEEFLAKGVGGRWYKEVEKALLRTRPGQAATVVYTSGTTGNPKGVLLSQDSLTWSCDQVGRELLTKKLPHGHMRTMSYLPLNHIAGQMMDIIAPLYTSSRKKGEYTTVFFPATCFLKKTCFKEQLVDAAPTLFLGVPEVWDGLKIKIEEATKGWLFDKINKVAPAILLKGVGLGSVQYAVSGAGPITKSTLNFFHDMGLDILNMFAQSESSALGTSWRNEDFKKFDLQEKFGSIGRALGNKVRIADPNDEGSGEIQLWGRNIMLGYMNRKDKTEEAITPDGWLRTGDQGRMDKDGFFFLTGRLKEIMKDKGGEMIAPVAVEEGIKKACNKPGASIIKQVIVVGDGKYYISALVTLLELVEEGMPTGKLTGGAKAVDPAASTVAQAIESDKWSTALLGCIAEYNAVAAKSQERVFRYLVLPKDITAEDSPDLMTPTFKIKRDGVSKRYKDEIETCGGNRQLESREVMKCGSDS